MVCVILDAFVERAKGLKRSGATCCSWPGSGQVCREQRGWVVAVPWLIVTKVFLIFPFRPLFYTPHHVCNIAEELTEVWCKDLEKYISSFQSFLGIKYESKKNKNEAWEKHVLDVSGIFFSLIAMQFAVRSVKSDENWRTSSTSPAVCTFCFISSDLFLA